MTLATAVTRLPSAGAPPQAPIRAGFLGGSHSHAAAKGRLVRASNRIELLGMAEAAEEVRAAYATPGARFTSSKEFMAASEVVFVESDVGDHACHALLALNPGKRV